MHDEDQTTTKHPALLLLHRLLQGMAIREEVYRLKSVGKTPEQILDSLLTKPPVIDPRW